MSRWVISVISWNLFRFYQYPWVTTPFTLRYVWHLLPELGLLEVTCRWVARRYILCSAKLSLRQCCRLQLMTRSSSYTFGWTFRQIFSYKVIIVYLHHTRKFWCCSLSRIKDVCELIIVRWLSVWLTTCRLVWAPLSHTATAISSVHGTLFILEWCYVSLHLLSERSCLLHAQWRWRAFTKSLISLWTCLKLSTTLSITLTHASSWHRGFLPQLSRAVSISKRISLLAVGCFSSIGLLKPLLLFLLVQDLWWNQIRGFVSVTLLVASDLGPEIRVQNFVLVWLL